MKNYMYISDLKNLEHIIKDAIEIKKNPHQFATIGAQKNYCAVVFQFQP